MDGLGDGDGLGFDMMMNQEPHLFTGYPQDGSHMAGMSAGSMYADDSLAAGDETNDAKRRRIARVGICSAEAFVLTDPC